MLIEFKVKNFRSFRDEMILDMEATPITEFDERLFSIAKSPRSPKILPCAAIYGMNASGKSNLLDAFEFMKNLVINSYQVEINEILSNASSMFHDIYNFYYAPFLLGNQNDKEDSEFEVYFYSKDNKRIFNYGFKIEDNKIVEEWLNTSPRTNNTVKEIFYRNYNELELPGLNKTQQKLITTSFKSNILILTLGKILNIPILETAFNWFKNIEFLNSESLTGFLKNLTSHVLFDDSLQKDLDEIRDYLASFDPSIVQLKIKDNNGKKTLYSVHKKPNGELVEFIFDAESAGTRKMFSLYTYLKRTLKNGGILVIDELNSQLHPSLQRFLITMFLNNKTNPNHAQLIFNTQDIWLLNNELFRRDEIWLVDKDEEGVSKLYSLYDVIDDEGNRVRKDESFNKNYFNGEYGATPYLAEFSFFEN